MVSSNQKTTDPRGFRMIDGKPRGDGVFNRDRADRWAASEGRGDTERSIEFAQKIKQIPQATRDQLTRMWEFEYEPRDDGGVGYDVIDNLWQVLYLCPGEPLKFLTEHGYSTSYVYALCQALGVDCCPPPIRKAV